MNSDKPNFLSQPAVKNIFVYRNGDPYYEGRRLVINEKRVNTFETFLKEVTGGIQAPFGAVRTIYTPKAGHRVSSLEHLQSGEQYVAAGKEKFKKLDYLHIGTKKKKMQQSNGQLKPVPQSRLIVSARFLKPIKEPCTIFILANGDVMTPAVRFLIPQRILVQYERVLQMITEKMGLRILGAVRYLYTLDGALISEGKELENGQFYVAVGREKFKKLPYSELIFNKPVGMRRFGGSKAASLPPIYRFRKQNGNQVSRDQSKSMVSSSEAGDTKTSPPTQQKDQLASIVNEISQVRLLKLRQKRSGMTMSLGGQSNGDGEQGAAENPGESSRRKEQPPDDSKDTAEEKQNSEEAEDPAAESSTQDATDALVNDAEVEKPTDRDTTPAIEGEGEQNDEKNSNTTSNSPEGEKESEKKSDSPSPAPDETDKKNVEDNNNTASALSEKEDEGEGSGDGVKQDKPEEEKADNSSDQMQGETEDKLGEEQSGEHKGPE